MAVAFRAADSSGNGGTAQSSLVVTKPTAPGTITTGDKMYLFLSWANPSATVVSAGGFAALTTAFTAPTGSMMHQLFVKDFSGDGASWTLTLSAAAKWFATVWAGSGIDQTTPNGTPTITGMSGSAPFAVASVPAAQGTWGVYFAAADSATTNTWTDTATERNDEVTGSVSSFLSGTAADSNGIITSTGTCGFTPANAIQGGAVCSIGVNASPAVASAGVAAVAVDAGTPGQTSTSNAAAGLATVSVDAYGASGGLLVNTATATVAAVAYGVQAVALTLPAASVTATAYGATVNISQPAGLATVTVDAYGLGLRHATPRARIVHVPAETRTFTVHRDDRGRLVPVDDRTFPA